MSCDIPCDLFIRELSVLLNYNVKMEAFLALLEEIEAKAGKGESVSSNSEMAVPQASTPGDMWSSELQGTLTELSNYCKNVLEHHLDIIKPKELREVLKYVTMTPPTPTPTYAHEPDC